MIQRQWEILERIDVMEHVNLSLILGFPTDYKLNVRSSTVQSLRFLYENIIIFI